MLDYLYPSKGPLLQFLANKAFLESSDQQPPAGLYFRLSDRGSSEIGRPPVCSTIRPCQEAHRVSFVQTWHFWKA